MADNKRVNSFNPINARLMANETSAEATGQHWIDFYSNSFQVRTDSGEDSAWNASSATYLYLAFAEQPIVANVGTNGIPATAR